MRALAILAVIAFHTGARAFGSGFYGVDVFFVLSGFLITTLLLQERAATGTISLRLFWGRRTARLLPALLVVCGLVAIISVVNAVVAVRPQAGSARLALAQGG
ncbi:MAG: acyltransferase family protein [Gaiellaceae bacterium]